jgi:hypothetical protein
MYGDNLKSKIQNLKLIDELLNYAIQFLVVRDDWLPLVGGLISLHPTPYTPQPVHLIPIPNQDLLN